MWSDDESVIPRLKAQLSVTYGDEFSCTSTTKEFLSRAKRVNIGTNYIKQLNEGPAEFVSIDIIQALKKRRVKKVEEIQVSAISESSTAQLCAEESRAAFETLLATQFQSLLEGHIKTALFLDTFNELIRLPQSLVSYLCRKVSFRTLSDEVLAELMSAVVDCESISFQNLVIFYQASLLGKVITLDTAPSRILLSTIFSATKANPKAVIQGLLSPLLTRSPPGKFQADIINRTVKESLDKPSIVYFLEVLSKESTGANVSETPAEVIQWNDYTISVIHSILVTKAPFKRGLLIDLLHIIEENFANFKNSPKYATLILLIVKNFSVEIKNDIDFITRVAENSTTFVKKSILATLKKLR